METRYLTIRREAPDEEIMQIAAALLREGRLVAFPTETVYGLGANGLDCAAVKAIYLAKGRPSDNPLILHIAKPEDAARLAREINANARALMAAFWPGPLTLVLPRRDSVPDAVTGGLDSVAIRLPNCPVARRLIELAGVPIAAPSANTSGRPSPTTAQAVIDDLAGRIDAVLDGGPCGIGLESTVVDCTTPVPTILRPGGITREQLEAVLGEVEIDAALTQPKETPRSPGMKYKHYAPKAPLFLFEGEAEATAAALLAEVKAALGRGEKVGALVDETTALLLPQETVTVCYGPRGDIKAAAARLYTALRSFDRQAVAVIYATGVAEDGLGLALMNRLRKASGYQIRCIKGGVDHG
ncbi:L-threonylcarbamoyladenylate synthase [Azotosporobacter soli]|uniref:L-threonylcarbamoyladenylate synthase n=1 Tax=Azotosporobacter soli TaxID=3055040 RepID=UPI0031FF22A9